MKKLLALTIVCIVVLSACANNSKTANETKGNENTESISTLSPTQAATQESTTEPAELLVSVWAGPHADLQKTIISNGYSANNVTVDDVDYGNLKTKQLTSFQAASGSGNYDVVWVNSQWMKEYVDNGYILPVDDYIASAGIDMSVYSAGLLEGCTYDGKVYGFPTYAQTLIIAYDSEVFEQEGQKVPTNVEELIQVAKYFKEKGTGIAIPAKQGGAATTLFSQLLYSDGGYYFNEAGALDLTSKECIYAASVYDQLAQYSIEGCLGWHHDEVAEAVRMKDAPIGIIMSGLANQNADPEKSLIVDTVKYASLSGKNGIAAASNTFWVWAVASNSAVPEASFDLSAWLASPETEKKQTLADQQISAINTLAEDPEILAKTPYLPVVMEQLSNGRMDPVLTNWGTLKENLIVALSEIASTDSDPETVLTKLQEQMKDVDFSK
jgi:ABC-type glycerol-3-phosphate transport system substrate-binding protein